MTIYVTKYALTEGIREMQATLYNGSLIGDPAYDYYSVKFSKEACSTLLRPGVEAFTSREEAITRAKQMQADKLKSLEKQMAKIQKLKFD